ncbi:MAG: TIGR01212 family radical SAM protein [Endomicrobiia bacterium]
MRELYYSFNTYLKEIFKERVHRISINAGFSCPNLDGKISNKGCIFCNNLAFVKETSTKSVEQQIIDAINFFSTSKQFKNIKKFIAYFQAYTNTYADLDKLKQTYDVIKKFPQIVGLSISTRPDCIDEEKLKLINFYTDNYLVWIEYGMQTSDDKILDWLDRGHTYKDFLKAIELTKKFPKINIGAHVILGLPQQDVIKDAKEITNLRLQGVKLHNLHVLKNTFLEKLYNENKVRIPEIDEYVILVCNFLENIPKNVVILRLVSSAKEEYLVSPLWMKNKFDIISKIKHELEIRNSYQGKKI